MLVYACLRVRVCLFVRVLAWLLLPVTATLCSTSCCATTEMPVVGHSPWKGAQCKTTSDPWAMLLLRFEHLQQQ